MVISQHYSRLYSLYLKHISAWQQCSADVTKYTRYLVVPLLQYGCEIWTLFTETERRIQAFNGFPSCKSEHRAVESQHGPRGRKLAKTSSG